MVTMREVAVRSGVSHTTVSHVLRDKTDGVSVSAATRERVLETARAMGYRPNASARSFRTGRFGGIGLLMSNEAARSGLPPALLAGIGDALAARELHLTLASLPDERLTAAAPKMLREWMCDGLLIDYTHCIPARLIEMIEAHRLPAVWLNSKRDADCVYPDDEGAARQLAERIVEAGHRRVAYLDFAHHPGDADDHYSARDRKNAVVQTLRGAGVSPVLMADEWVALARWSARIEELLKRPDRPTAILGYGAEIEAALLAAARCGLEVPRDLTLASFGSPGRLCAGVELSQMAVPEAQLGERAIAMLMQKIEDRATVLAPQIVPFAWEAGATFGPVG